MSEIRVFAAVRVNTSTAPTNNQWNNLFIRTAQDGVLTRAIVQAANATNKAENKITYEKRNRGTNPNSITLVGFEISPNHVDELVAVINAQAAARGITGDAATKCRLVLQAELRDAATALYGAAVASVVTVPIIHYAGRMAAISAVQTYLANNSGIWYAA